MMRIAPLLSEIAARKGEKSAKANAASLSNEECRAHHFMVIEMAVVKSPITPGQIAGELAIPNEPVTGRQTSIFGFDDR
jgi:hypothetical protein